MTPVYIILRQPKNPNEDSARALLRDLTDSGFDAEFVNEKAIHEERGKLSISPQIFDGMRTEEFIRVMRRFMEENGDQIVELEFAGNRFLLDSFSIHRAIYEIMKLSSNIGNLEGSRVVIGSSNTINSSGSWPRK